MQVESLQTGKRCIQLLGKRRRHVPLRTCIGCQQRRPKRELIRIVRTPEGVVEIDPKGKRSGRGAYLCLDHACWGSSLQTARLSRALKCQVTSEDVVRLREALEEAAETL